MKLQIQSPKRALNKAFLKQRPLRSEINLFKTNLIRLLGKIDEIEREENQKNHVRDFLRDTFYKDTNEINTKGSNDLVIHLGKTNKDKVGVIIEAKRPGNKAEMMSAAKPNAKALQELVLYYLRERIEEDNIDIKYLVVTNIYEWFIIDASYFEKLFFRNAGFVKEYKQWMGKQKVTADTKLFYESIAKPFIDNIKEEIPCTYFDLRHYEKALKTRDKEEDKSLIALFKILSPYHLLKLPFADDSNKLNDNFYKELLHIIGLEEAKDGGKFIIRRKQVTRHPASLLEQVCDELKTIGLHKVSGLNGFGETYEEQEFSIALELCITWINRILFLKLLEGQLITYHAGDKSFRFLNSETIHDFDELSKLFHNVLARKQEERTQAHKEKYPRVPYLNSSLFEISELEDQTLKINSLDNSIPFELLSTSVLKEQRKKGDKLPALDYLFKFLDAYDFASEGAENIQEDSKNLINASVLGKVFEKINGYKDGSVFTPGFITMYMCRQTIRLAVIQKFKDAYGWKINEFDDLKNYLLDKRSSKEILNFNKVINSLHICDPAVGSGHFLVSSLNEIIAIKSELGILADENGTRLGNFEISVVNDELVIADENESIFEYLIQSNKPQNREAQRFQKSLFHEKQNIIENCLFGVDINTNSVKICRLRLWIELLKNAYYKEETNFSQLETLPNIDINIKCGNSLVSRFPLDADLGKALKSIKYNIEQYRGFVNDYKNERNRDVKRGLQKIIDGIKGDFRTQIFQNDPKLKKLQKLQYEFNLLVAPNIFKEDEADYGNKNYKKDKKEKIQQLEMEINKLSKEIDEVKSNKIYSNSFEWRFEFPEVLNDNGDFEGFDVVIGNPPYGVSIKDTLRKAIINNFGKVPDYEIYYFFINLSSTLLKDQGIKSFIIPNTILFNVFAKEYRESLFNNWNIKEILDCTDFNIFEGAATVRNIITLFKKDNSSNKVFYRPTAKALSFSELINRELFQTEKSVLLANNQNWALIFKLSPLVLNIVSKIKQNKKSLIEYFPEISQGLIAYDKYQGQNQQIIKSRAFHSTTKQKGFKPWLWGADVTRYQIEWNKKEYINYGDGIANPREQKFFKSERILVREITNPFIYAGYTDREMYNDPSIINILKSDMSVISLKVLLGILNSKLATFYHFNSSPKATKGAFPKILVEDIKKFPLPDLSQKQQKIFIDLADKILKAKQQGKDSPALEEKIDKMVYELYDITPAEQKIVEGVK